MTEKRKENRGEKSTKIKVGFLGYGTRALDALMEDERFEVRYFFTPIKNLCEEVRQAHERYGELIYREIKGKAELGSAFEECRDVDCFVMNACSIILDEAALEKMEVYNIHPGSLRYNRGHHPHLWTVRLCEKETEINLHKVTPQIDLGEVIAQAKVSVSPDMDALAVLNALEDKIPKLLSGLYRYLTGEQKAAFCISEGAYRRAMLPEDYQLMWETDTPEVIRAKVLCRAAHQGAFFGWHGYDIYVDHILEEEQNEAQKPQGLSVELREEAKTVRVENKGSVYLFHVNQIVSKQQKKED